MLGENLDLGSQQSFCNDPQWSQAFTLSLSTVSFPFITVPDPSHLTLFFVWLILVLQRMCNNICSTLHCYNTKAMASP